MLVVEDDESYQELYKTFFARLYSGEFIGILAKTGKEAFAHLKRHPSPPIDAVILDWCLPDTPGLAILRHIRSTVETNNVLVFMVTGNKQDQDTDAALEARADEYITKPFRENELFLKLRNHLERGRANLERRGLFKLDGLKLDVKNRAALLKDNRIPLPDMEFDLLALFMERPGILHAQTYLAEVLSPTTEPLSPEAVRKHVSNLRKALGKWGERIEVRWGRGYSLNAR